MSSISAAAHPPDEGPNPLISLFRQCVVRIDGEAEHFRGTGCLVAPGVVLTCAHVVHGLPSLHVTWGDHIALAKVLASIPSLQSVSGREVYPLPDLAVLEVDGALEWAHPCIRLATRSPGLGPSPDSFYIAGYAIEHGDRPVLTGVTTEFESPVIEGEHSLYKLKRGQFPVGFSGSPMLNLRSGMVAGLVESTRGRGADLGGFAVPILELGAFPDVVDANRRFHDGDFRWRVAAEAEGLLADEVTGVPRDDGRELQTDRAARWAIETGSAVAALSLGHLRGQSIAVSGGEDGSLQVWELSTGTRQMTITGHTGPIWTVALGELDGAIVAVSAGDDLAIRLWDLTAGGVPRAEIQGHTAPVNSVAVGYLDDRLIAVSASDDRTIRIWNLRSGQQISTLTAHQDWVNSVALGELDGRLIAVSGSSDQTLRLWDLADSSLIAVMTGHAASVSCVAVGLIDGRLAAVSGSADETVCLWDLTSHQLLSTIPAHEGRVRAVALGEVDGRAVAVSGGDDGALRAWALPDGEAFGGRVDLHVGPVRAVCFRTIDDQPTFISGGDDRTIRRWVARRDTEQGDQVEWLSDSPAHTDSLHRRPLARTLATRLQRFQREEPGTSFLVHIDGSWGTGKSTLLNLIQSELPDQWLIVDFDAWRQSKIGPPWWTLLAALRHDFARQLTLPRRAYLRIIESIVRARRTGAPFALAILLLAAAGVGLIAFLRHIHLGSAATLSLATALAGIVTALGVLWAGALVAGKFLLWDSPRGARLFEQSNSNPMQDIASHFAWLTSRARRPVLFFVDNLDRCGESYVVDFLEAVQTLLRDSGRNYRKPSSRDISASFVIAADGRWIRRSYEICYASFDSPASEPGRPLGYRFLDKIFQLRVPLPAIAPQSLREYLKELLGVPLLAAQLTAEEKGIRDRLGKSATETEVVEILRSASPTIRVRVASEAVDKLSEPEVMITTEHWLQRFAALLDGNPRTMKRFINDYGILRAVRTLEGNPVASHPLALWAILETQWPALADYLRDKPEAIEQLTSNSPSIDTIPSELRPLFGDNQVRRIATFEHGGPLTPELIRSCYGISVDNSSN